MRCRFPALRAACGSPKGSGRVSQAPRWTPALRPALVEALAAGKQPEIYVCGPPALIDGCERLVEELGLPTAKLHIERFLPA